MIARKQLPLSVLFERQQTDAVKLPFEQPLWSGEPLLRERRGHRHQPFGKRRHEPQITLKSAGMSTQISRRNFLSGAAAMSALMMSTRLTRAFEEQRRFAPVKVSRDRVIREVVGLRPYRPSGFVVDAERFGKKLLVHNYGHGGGGVTLSWGTASLAVDLARDFINTSRTHPRRF